MDKALPPSPPPGHSHLVRTARWAGTVAFGGVGALLLGLALLLGCDATSRYKTLAFFFDGVPLPPGMAPPPGSPEALALAAADAETPAPIEYFYHTPYAERNCFGCHSRETGFNITANADLCRRCHSDYLRVPRDDWVHGPVAQQMCGFCHEAHKSEYPGLLKTGQQDLCGTCHDLDRVRQDPFHAAHIDEQACSTCHDPHAAGNRMLLADGRTFQRRYRAAADTLITPHNDWPKETCANCHDLGRSNRLLTDIAQQCIACHPGVMEIPAAVAPEEGSDAAAAVPPSAVPAAIHPAVTDGKCLACHTAHRSTRPNLLRLTAQDMCVECHKLEKLPENPHRAMVRVDCLICHAGHHSAQPHLLRPHLLESYFVGHSPTTVVPAFRGSEPTGPLESPSPADTQPSPTSGSSP